MARLSSKPKKVTCFVADSAMPERLQAVGLALALLRRVKHPTWDELVEAAMRGDEATTTEMAACYLDEGQLALLSTHAGVVRQVSTRSPMRSVAQCDACEQPLVLAGAVPARCAITRGCDGKYVKAKVAKVERVDSDELDTQVPEQEQQEVAESAGDVPVDEPVTDDVVLDVSAVVADGHGSDIDWDDVVDFTDDDFVS